MSNYLILSFLAGALSCYSTGLWTFLANRSRKTNRAWLYLSLCAGTWSLCHFLMAIIKTKEDALILVYILYLCAILIPGLFLRFILLLVDQYQNEKIYYYISLIFAFLFVCLLPSKFFVKDVIPKLVFNFYDDLGFIGFLYFTYYSLTAGFALFILFKTIKSLNNSLKKTQLSYMAIAALLGFLGGGSSFLIAFNIENFPYFLIFFPLYPIIVSYAVIKYRFLDITVIITRAGIFLTVYSLVLGLPVWVGFKLLGKGLWLLPVSFMGVLATVGPFIYLFLQKQAEDRLLQEQRRYQATLRQASAGMGKIKDLKKLLNMIVYVLTHAIQIEHALVYIYDERENGYLLGAYKKRIGNKKFIENIDKKSPLIQHLLRDKNFIIFDEIKQKAQDFRDQYLIKITEIILSLDGALISPIFVDQLLIAIIVMGKKVSGKTYTEDDISTFSILANQTALAIENAKFYEDMKSTQEQLFKAEKMATIGTMADGLSHQINNRFHALGFIAGDAVDTIRLKLKEPLTDDMKELLAELERAFTRVEDNVKQGGEIVQGLLKYTRKGDGAFTAVDIDAVLKAALEMVQFKIKTHEMKLIREYDAVTIPKIKGNFTQLQEVFFNLIDNGYDAMMQRKTEAKEASYQATLIVRIKEEDGYAQIIFEDNGMGVKDEDMRKLFTPFFTTKLSSKKGTGLGLYVIKKIVEDNHGGSVDMVSKYMSGTQMKLRLPIAIE